MSAPEPRPALDRAIVRAATADAFDRALRIMHASARRAHALPVPEAAAVRQFRRALAAWVHHYGRG